MDSIKQILRAAGIAAFTVGLLLMVLNPPSLSGFGGLLTWTLAGVAFVIFMGWLTVTLMGRQSMTEQEFDRLVMRSEELARNPVEAQDATEFELLVADAIDRLPAEFQKLLEDTAVVVSPRGAEFGAYGHYYGGGYTRGDYEHRIVLYQDTLERDFGWDSDVLRSQVERTLRHELAHHLGWHERGVRELGL